MLKDTLSTRARDAMKSRDAAATSIFRLAKGELDTLEARLGRPVTDDEGFAVVRKLIKSNEETLAATVDAAKKDVLANENELLRSVLPASLSVDAIVAALSALHADIKAAKADGPATGIAMKHLKASGAVAESADVMSAVKRIRT